MEDDDGEAARGVPWTCDWAVAAGAVGLVSAVVPVVGDVIAATLGTIAFVLGCLGIRATERDGRPGVRRAVTGTLLGMAAIGAVLFTAIATLRPDVG